MPKRFNTSNNASQYKIQVQNKKKEYIKRLFGILYKQPISRRMAATYLGFTDQTYMVTPHVLAWIKQGKAQVVGVIKCQRSGKCVQKVTTNPDWFISNSNNQLNLFE